MDLIVICITVVICVLIVVLGAYAIRKSKSPRGMKIAFMEALHSQFNKWSDKGKTSMKITMADGSKYYADKVKMSRLEYPYEPNKVYVRIEGCFDIGNIANNEMLFE